MQTFSELLAELNAYPTPEREAEIVAELTGIIREGLPPESSVCFNVGPCVIEVSNIPEPPAGNPGL